MKPWKKLEQELAYDGYRKVIRKKFLMPDGATETFDIFGAQPSVHILALTPEETVVLIRAFRPGTEKFSEELPAGIIDHGESPLDAAIRELREETGYAGEMRLVAQYDYSPYSETTVYCFVATSCRKIAEQSLDSSEFLTVVEKPLEELRRELKEGQLVSSVCAYAALDHLGLL